MSNSSSDFPLVPLLCVVALFAFAGWLVGETMGENYLQREAVMHGAAQWVPNGAGDPQFKWVTKPISSTVP